METVTETEVTNDLKIETIMCCGKPVKAPYKMCFKCLQKKRKTQSVCECGKYFNSKTTDGKNYNQCYNCYTKSETKKSVLNTFGIY